MQAQNSTYQETNTSGAAIAAFICSLLGLWVAGIPIGIHARREIDSSEGRKTGRGFATAGIVIGTIHVIAGTFIIIALTGGPNMAVAALLPLCVIALPVLLVIALKAWNPAGREV